MDFGPAPRRITGALAFLAELDAFADECVATGAWEDELTARRRAREGVQPIGELGNEDVQVKAL